MSGKVWIWGRWLLFGALAALLLVGAAGRQRQLAEEARREDAARREAARVRALEDRVIFHPDDAEALVALAQTYAVTHSPAEAAALRARVEEIRARGASKSIRHGDEKGSPPSPPIMGGASEPAVPAPPIIGGLGGPPGQGQRGSAGSQLVSLLARAAREPSNLALQREVVARCQEQGQLAAAIPALERLARAEPADAVTWRRLGIAELQAGRSRTARDHLRVAVSRNPKDPVALFYLGLVYGSREEASAALSAFARVQALQPDYAPAALERIRLQIEEWRLQEAAVEAQRLIRRRPRLADAHYQRGVALFHLRDLAAAETELETATRLDPRPARYHGWLGLTRIEQGRLPEAIAALETAIARNPAYSSSHYQLGRAYLLQGRLDDAEPALRRALLLDPRFTQACVSLGQLLTRRGRRADAAILFARARTLTRFEERRDYLARRAQSQPNRPEWRRRLGDLYAREGLLREARAQYERAGELERERRDGRTGHLRRMEKAPPAPQ